MLSCNAHVLAYTVLHNSRKIDEANIVPVMAKRRPSLLHAQQSIRFSSSTEMTDTVSFKSSKS